MTLLYRWSPSWYERTMFSGTAGVGCCRNQVRPQHRRETGWEWERWEKRRKWLWTDKKRWEESSDGQIRRKEKRREMKRKEKRSEMIREHKKREVYWREAKRRKEGGKEGRGGFILVLIWSNYGIIEIVDHIRGSYSWIEICPRIYR